MPRDEAVLLDILKAANLTTEFVRDFDKLAFLADAKTQSAVVHQLLIIGEATKRLSEAFRNQQGTIPWRIIARMRDVLIHHYDSVDVDEVWKTATTDVPVLATFITSIVGPQTNP